MVIIMTEIKKPKNKTGQLSADERSTIYALLDTHTDAEIADIVRRTPELILQLRRTATIHKANDKTKDAVGLLHAKHYWNKIKEQLLDDEVAFFESEWAAYCIQFQDLVHTDEDTIRETIMLTIQINRLLVQQKTILENMADTKLTIDAELQLPPKDRDKESLRAMRDMLTGFQTSLQSMGKQLETLQSTKDRKFSQLKATREQRFKRIEESKKNIFELLKLLAESDQRQQENRMLSLVKKSTQKIKEEWMEPTEFPDGSMDSLLLSEDTIEYLRNKKDE